jgi:SSS family solute:Na+ symporter
VAAAAPEVKITKDGGDNLLCWLAGCVMIYGALFGTGKLIFGDYPLGMGMLAAAAGAGYFIYRNLNRRGWASIVD